MTLHHSDLSHSEFLYSLESCRLDPVLFNHEAHLRLAYLQISKNPLNMAIKNTCEIIQRYVQHLGAQDKYHHTLTVAAVHIVYHFKKKSTTGEFDKFLEEFPRLISNFKSLIDSHYRSEIFHSSVAKSEYVEPDLLPFD